MFIYNFFHRFYSTAREIPNLDESTQKSDRCWEKTGPKTPRAGAVVRACANDRNQRPNTIP